MGRTWIPILVDSDDYEEVAALVVKRADERGDSDVPHMSSISFAVPTAQAAGGAPNDRAAVVAAERLANHVPWEIESLERLADPNNSALTAKRWVRAMDACLDHADDPFPFVSTSQICKESGMTLNEWRDAPRKLPRHLAKHYPSETSWPLALFYGTKVGLDREMYWGMTQEQAKRWRQVRSDD